MNSLTAIAGFIILIIILWDGFEVIILPRRVARRFRLSRFFYLSTWAVWSWVARHITPPNAASAISAFTDPCRSSFSSSLGPPA